MSITAYFDGAITKNPGGIGSSNFIIYRDKDDIIEYNEDLGTMNGFMTSNVAEWKSLECLLRYIEDNFQEAEDIEIIGDSQLVIYGISGKWRVKAELLKEIYNTCASILRRLEDKRFNIDIRWESRDSNKAHPVKESIDKQLTEGFRQTTLL